MSMTRRERSLLILGGVLLLAAAAYFILSGIDWDAGGDSSAVVASIEPDRVTSVRWKDITFDRADGVWTYAADPDRFDVDQEAAGVLLDTLKTVTADFTIAEPSALSEYGLDSPLLTISVSGTEGEAWEFQIGSQNELNSEYYMLFNGDESTVYLVDSLFVNAFTADLYDFLAPLPETTFGTPTELTVASAQDSLRVYKPENASALSYTPLYEWFSDSGSGTLLPAYSSTVDTLFTDLTSLVLDNCVDYFADSDELAAYGLDAANAVTVTMAHETEDGDGGTVENQYSISFGHLSDDGAYAQVGGTNRVYLVTADYASELTGVTAEGLRPTAVCAFDWTDLKALTFAADGETRTVVYEGTREQTTESESTDENGSTVTEEQTAYTDVYSMNGVALDGSSVQTLLESIDALTRQGTASNVSASDLWFTVTVTQYSESFPEMTLRVWKFSDSACLCEFNGELTLVSLSGAEAVRDAALALTEAEP